MIRTIEVVGQSGQVYTAVAPTLLPGRRLEKTVGAYFPYGDIDGWFKHGEQWRKSAIGAMWGEECVVSGQVPADTHEIVNQGMGERLMTLVPWNMIRLSHEVHITKIHGYVWKVMHWDPLAIHKPLLILMSDGAVVSCWYNLPFMDRERLRGYR